MITFPNAKINLGLNVLHKRKDGYHDIESLMVPIPLCDVLELVVDTKVAKGEVVFTRTGLQIPGNKEKDLCWQAVQAVSALRELPGLRLHLHKVIPMGAGLGGGSSDGARTLVLLNDLLGLKLSAEQLHELAFSLGSDCPFFIENNAQLAQGRGEILNSVDLDLSGYWLVLINPGVHVPTPEVYKNTAPTNKKYDANWNNAIDLLHSESDRVISKEKIRKLIPNAMEEYVFKTYPIVLSAYEKLSKAGAVHAAMSGSGSTVFGLFNEQPKTLKWPADHSVWTFKL